ncbi:beta-adaptin [Savitreella phatthalungensis]
MTMATRVARAVQNQLAARPAKGETFELRRGLVSQYAWERKDSIQRTIAAMTLGKDVSALFPDVLKNIATHDIAQKKLVYLYLMNYARAYPDLCILAVNTFVQDSQDPNPLVRALAIRTMGCIRVDKMVDYLPEPLRRTLKDDSPYVRKTAAVCVAKLFDLNAELCVEDGFLEALQNLLHDSNASVVANAVSALAEIQEVAPDTQALLVTSEVFAALLSALNECSEWGRIAILSALKTYDSNDEEAKHICERVVPQFQHANASVVMAAVSVVMHNLLKVSSDQRKTMLKKMAPSLVTLISSPPELQYVALRNINLLLQQQPDILAGEIRVFFCKYNDPPYVKNEKLAIMVMLAQESNLDQLLAELKEYASEIDMDFVRRAVRAIGQCAIKLDEAAERCINVLLELINTRVAYVVQESIVIIKDIFRRYPHRYESIIPQLCGSVDELDDPSARGALIWIIGEYAERIDNATALLTTFTDGFKDEYTQTQLALLTAVIKLFLKKPTETQTLVQRMLQTASQTDNSDIRDRAFIYWRLLSSDVATARAVVLATEKPPIDGVTGRLRAQLLDELTTELSSIASVYHAPASTFVVGGKPTSAADAASAARTRPTAGGNSADQPAVENLLDFDLDGAAPASLQQGGGADVAPADVKNAMDDLFDLFGNNNNGGGGDVSAGGSGVPASSSTAADLAGGFAALQNLSISTPLAAATAAHNGAGDDFFADMGAPSQNQPKPTTNAKSSATNDMLDLI